MMYKKNDEKVNVFIILTILLLLNIGMIFSIVLISNWAKYVIAGVIIMIDLIVTIASSIYVNIHNENKSENKIYNTILDLIIAFTVFKLLNM